MELVGISWWGFSAEREIWWGFWEIPTSSGGDFTLRLRRDDKPMRDTTKACFIAAGGDFGLIKEGLLIQFPNREPVSGK